MQHSAAAQPAPKLVDGHLAPQPERKSSVVLDERGLLDVPFLVLTVLLVIIGVVMMFSASYARAYYKEQNSTYYFARQALFALVGIGMMLFVSRLNYQMWRGLSVFILAGAIFFLILVGIIYITETLSVILQVTYFKLTHGKRIFRMTPIHHHFEMGGWSEEKIVAVFAGITVVMCVLAYFGIVNRY